MKQNIHELELSLLSPSVRRSPEQLNQLIADAFIEFGSSGKKLLQLCLVLTSHTFKRSQ